MFEKACWIGLPDREYDKKKVLKSDSNGRFAYFRHEFLLKEKSRCTLHLSANCRYRMWVNESPVLSGPCRGDAWYTYYDTVDISPYLQIGANVIAIQVLFSDEHQVINGADERAALYSVISHFPEHLLLVEGVVTTEQTAEKDEVAQQTADAGMQGENVEAAAGTHVVTTGIAPWNVSLEGSFYLIKKNLKNEFMGAMTEDIDTGRTEMGWKKISFDDSHWSEAVAKVPAAHDKTRQLVGLMDGLHLYPRPIPLLKEESPVSLQELPIGGKAAFSQGKVTLLPHTKIQILLTSEVLMNGYLQLGFAGGAGSRITICCFEKFYNEKQPVKRDDAENGKMYGEPQADTLVLNGEAILYEPFWYRTLRFLQLDITTAEEPLTVEMPRIRKMSYPLNAAYHFQSENARLNTLWDMCQRTLENCMTDAYMDCPFWEQMQYPMDTRLQALFTYACDGDTGLIKKALWEFHCSKLPCGLIQGKAPSSFPQVISTFALHYIFMIKEYIDATGDVEEIRGYLGDVDDILTYYDRHRESRYHLVGNIGHWPFVDWQEAWAAHGGIPSALDHGPSTIINLMYAYALEQAACIMEAEGRKGMAEEYRSRKDEITSGIQTFCYNEEKHLYREGPAFEEYSQHAQSWAVLLGMQQGQQAACTMEAAFAKDVIPCSFSTSYELFRACEKAGVYELTFGSLQRWLDLIDEHCTTCPETPEYTTRSECHAWSALPMYELRHHLKQIENAFI